MTKHSGQSDHFVDYYQLLGVTKSADVTTIKRAYRSQIARHHPDRADGKPDDEVASLLNAAYATLKDHESRQAYDNELMEHHQKLWLADKKRQLTEKIEGFAHRHANKVGQALKSRLSPEFHDQLGVQAGRLAGHAIKHAKQLWHKLAQAQSMDLPDDLPLCAISLSTAYQGGQISLWVDGRQLQTTLPKGIGHGEVIQVIDADRTYRIRIAIDTPDVQVRDKDVYYTVRISTTEAMIGTQVQLPPPLSLQLGVPAHAYYPTSVRLSGRGLPSGDGAGDLVVVFELDA